MAETLNNDDFGNLVRKHQNDFCSLFDFRQDEENTVILDFTSRNNELQSLDLRDTIALDHYVSQQIKAAHALAGAGGYNEERVIYQRSPLFTDAQGLPRFIHLGIDIWVKAYSKIYAPLDGTIHSLKNNAGFGDFGPTIILKHQLDNCVFFTLYGHLSQDSVERDDLQVGAALQAGQYLGRVGSFPVNGDWPPHVHIQLIRDMLDYKGDFPGVCSAAEQERMLRLCPDPNLILQIPQLS